MRIKIRIKIKNGGRGVAGVLAVAVMAAGMMVGLPLGWGQTTAGGAKDAGEPRASGRLALHSETSFGHELLRLNQADVIKAMVASARVDDAAMWKAEVPLAPSEWKEISKSRAEVKKATQEYVANLKAYLDSLQAKTLPGPGLVKEVPDGFWGVDHVKFIFGELTRPIIMSMEYFGANEKSRAELKPIAVLSARVLAVTDDGLLAIRESEEKRAGKGAAADLAFAEGGVWNQAYAAGAIPQYYRPFSLYFQAMAMDPAESAARRKLLLGAVEQLKPFIESEDASEDVREKEVKNPALLLRGKCYSELGKFAEATKDLTEAQSKANLLKGEVPEWLVYQAKYQLVVTKARNGEFDGARTELTGLRATIPTGTKEAQLAQVSLDLLGFRVAWMEAEAKPEAARMPAKLEAMKTMAAILGKGPMFRDLVYEQLASQVSAADESSGKLLPLQSLAVAWNKALAARTDEAKKETLLLDAVKLCEAVRANAAATAEERTEATWLAAVCLGELKKYEEAVGLDLAFAEMAPPKDERIVKMIDTSLAQLKELKEQAGKANATVPPSVDALAQKALALKTGKDPVGGGAWWYPLGRSLENQHKLPALAKAEEAFLKVPPTDPNYLDAQFHRLRVNALRLDILNNQKAAPAETQAAASSLVDACATFRKAVGGNPPARVSKEAIERAKTQYETDVRFIEIAVRLNPLEQADPALKLLSEVETEFAGKLTDAQQGMVLRYRILAYQIKKVPEKAIETVNKYATRFPEKAGVVMQELVGTTYSEIEVAKDAGNAERAKLLADQLVGLMGSLIEQTNVKANETGDKVKKKEVEREAYLYRQLQGQMLIEAGRAKEARDLFLALQKEKADKNEEDAFNHIWAAHSEYAMGNFGAAQEAYGKLIPRLSPPTAEKEAPAYWECYYKMIMANEQLIKSDPPERAKERREQNLQVLKDLRGVYQSKIGGEKLKEQYRELVKKYGLDVP